MPENVIEKSLARFVDRRNELSSFCEMISGGTHPVMVISGPSAIGKSSLLIRLVDECLRQGVVCVEVNCKETRNSNYQKIMVGIADQLGKEHFQHFLNLVNHFANPRRNQMADIPAIKIQGDVVVGEVNPGAVVAGVVIEKVIAMPGLEISVPEADRIAPLTDRFLADLEPLLAKHPIVFCFDQLDNATTETRNWIWEELLRPLRRGRGLPGARFVICVQGSPALEAEIGDLRLIIKRADLSPLGDGDIAEYLARRAGSSRTEDEFYRLAEAIYVKTNGIPGEVVSYADAIDRHREKKGASAR